MESNFKNCFETIKDYKNDIDNVFRYIKNKTEILTSMYNEYLKEIKDTVNYRLSLDSFNFQTKLINIEYDNYNRILKFFINRMYGDYYKLYNKLIDYVKKNVKNVKIINDNEYPKYKDLEVNVEYNMEIIDNVYSNILSILTELSNYCLKENHLIKEIKKKQNNGININNFLNEKKYSIIILKQKINFYYEILKGYIESQKKFFKRLYLKLKLIYAQLCHDINLETSVSKNNSNFSKINSFSTERDEHDECDDNNECEQYNDFLFDDSHESLFESNIENELNKHFKLIDINEKTNKEDYKEDNKEDNKKKYIENEKELKQKHNEQEHNEQEHNEQEHSDQESEESIDSVEYMKFF